MRFDVFPAPMYSANQMRQFGKAFTWEFQLLFMLTFSQWNHWLWLYTAHFKKSRNADSKERLSDLSFSWFRDSCAWRRKNCQKSINKIVKPTISTLSCTSYKHRCCIQCLSLCVIYTKKYVNALHLRNYKSFLGRRIFLLNFNNFVSEHSIQFF